MNINEILDQMAHDITALTFGEKMAGGLAVTFLSMLIVFAVLVLLIGVIKSMELLLNSKPKQGINDTVDIVDSTLQEVEVDSEDSLELVAVITAAIACSMGVSQSKIRVVNVNRVSDVTPTWAKNGRIEQIQNRL
ncbi:Sodium pump decarboxylase, gamma subunit [Acetoanaerobium sticklandii]|uniref:Sodium pump decarboxylase, gamma subunit n=1 Tax=Acetoanaerobium sticklandii (strain ATCC 12662 / DSM 519 / JCM 1433 / CCUG 9281 / NCIMB 10654 / HF) TaxID=499177 RepID=E3PXA3_ACESD|nr:OadG family protein [Acetoanaerobium sticklandii]CBH21068.1 Sodium pump decarboxylase, gamma subunit [Acetoanaerobium sticklandii]